MPDYPSRNRRLNESFNHNYKIKVASKYCNKFNLKLNLQSATKKKKELEEFWDKSEKAVGKTHGRKENTKN